MPTLIPQSQAVRAVKSKLAVFQNSYTKSYITQLVSSPEVFHQMLMKNELREYKKLGEYNRYWQLIGVIPVSDNEVENRKFKRYIDKNRILIELYIKEKDLFLQWTKWNTPVN